METIIILLAALVALDLAAWRWGFKSSEGAESLEWKRRRNWRAFH